MKNRTYLTNWRFLGSVVFITGTMLGFVVHSQAGIEPEDHSRP